MMLREYQEEDAAVIAGWIRSQDELYQWSADCFCKYPLSGKDIDEYYEPQIEWERFYPLTAVDENGDLIGHLAIRYPDDSDGYSVRFAFVIVNPSFRGKGYGKELLQLGIEYVKKYFSAWRIESGVFENHESARHSYETAGFQELARRKRELPIGIWNLIEMELMIKKPLETERLILRRFQESDAEDVYRYASDIDVGPIAGWPPHKSIEESREVVKHVLNGKECYAICLKDDNKVIGAIELKLNGYTDMTTRDDECEIGYWLGKPFWGQGIMMEAVEEMLRHAFEDCRMQKVWVGYYEGNLRSKRVQEKCGFKYQWKTEGLDVPLMHETRTGYVSLMTKGDWLSRKGG